MQNKSPSKIVFLTLIAGRKQRNKLLDALSMSGLKLINTMYGEGNVRASYLMNVLGLIPEEHKIVITGLLSEENTEAVFAMLVEKFHFNKPNTGVAFTIPIESLSY